MPVGVVAHRIMLLGRLGALVVVAMLVQPQPEQLVVQELQTQVVGVGAEMSVVMVVLLVELVVRE
jgi:hypothetical protein